MKKCKGWLVLLLAMLMIPGWGSATEPEEDYHYIAPKPIPKIRIESPKNGQTWEKGGKLTVDASCEGAKWIQAILYFPSGNELLLATGYEEDRAGDQIKGVFSQQPGEYFTTGAKLEITAHLENGMQMQKTVNIISPKDQLIKDMLAEALDNSTDKYYRYAPAQEDWDRGLCKNFVMRLFDTYSGAYRMAEYPEMELYMPKNKSKADSAPYDYGIEWRPEGPEDGAPFEIAAQFKYDASLSKAENQAACRKVLESVQKGDFFQMVGYYYWGNGPHSLLFMEDYDAVNDEVHWTDSNMKGDRVDGYRWGYIQYDAVKSVDWFVEAICTKNRGCTIYRLRDDLYIQ
ncbi:MAG: hypothetical protein E7324_08710 [Clostridiales bacterium]|nr:hypothetical protein [Clostridiales bacterium]